MRGALAVYQAVGWAALALGWPVLGFQALRDPRFRVGWKERLGGWGAVPRGGVWVHGASVGEMRAAAPLIHALRNRDLPLVLSTTSPSGREVARELAGPRGAARLLPLDLSLPVRHVLRESRPRALVVLETELWPELLWETQNARVPAVLVNARISDRTYPWYRRARRWVGPLLEGFRVIHAQSERDAQRFRTLRSSPHGVEVGGNLKFDLPVPNPSSAATQTLRSAKGPGRRVVVAGSTHAGEEEALLSALAPLEEKGLRVILVLAPRHLERIGEVERLLCARGYGFRRWSSMEGPGERFRARQVLLVDRYGVLSRLYGAADCAFVGGSLVPVGGHNLLEPLRWGVPVLFGPYTQNAPDVRDEVVRRNLGFEIHGVDELTRKLERYLTDRAARHLVRGRARALFEANCGAVEKALQALGSLGVLESDRRP